MAGISRARRRPVCSGLRIGKWVYLYVAPEERPPESGEGAVTMRCCSKKRVLSSGDSRLRDRYHFELKRASIDSSKC